MTTSSGKTKPVTSDVAPEYERWDLPSFSGGQQSGGQSLGQTRRSIKEKDIPPKPPTAEEIEAIRKDAYEAGFNEGKQEGIRSGHAQGLETGHAEGIERGLKEGRALGEQEIQNEISRLRQMLAQVKTPVERERDALQDAIVQAIVSLSESVVAHDLRLTHESIAQSVEQALQFIDAEAPGIHIHLHPDDLALLRGMDFQTGDNISWAPDPSLSIGSCLVETPSQWVDFTIDNRFKQASQAWLGARIGDEPEQYDEKPQQKVEKAAETHVLEQVAEPEVDAPEKGQEKETEQGQELDQQADLDMQSEETISQLLKDNPNGDEEPF